jgi:hypothetical protein
MPVHDDQNITVIAPGSRLMALCDGSWVDVQIHTPNMSGYTASAITPADRFTYATSLFCAERDPDRKQRAFSGPQLVPFCSSHPQTCSPVAINPGLPVAGGDVGPVIEDLKDYAAERAAITELSRQHVLELAGRGKFAPSTTLTRGELAVELNRAFQIPAPKFPVVFTDVDSGNVNYPLFAKAQPYLDADQGIGGAYVFHEDAPMERQQVAAMAVALLEGAHMIDLMRDAKEISTVLAPLADEQMIAPDLRPYVATALRAKLLSVAGNTFAAGRLVTRGEWAQILWIMQKALAKR